MGGAWTEDRLSKGLSPQLLGPCVFTQRSQVHNGFLGAFLATAVSLQGDQRVEVELWVAVMRQRRVEAAADVI